MRLIGLINHIRLIGLISLIDFVRRIRDKRQFDDEGRALIGSWALSAHAAPMHLRQVAHYRQSKPQSSLPPRARAVALTEAVEDERQKFGGDSGARVADRDLYMLARALHLHLDLSSIGSELDR